MKEIKKRLKSIINICFQPYMRILPGSVAYSLMMAVIPILSITVMLCNSLHLSSDLLFERMGDIVPGNILNILIEYMDGSTFNSIILIIAGIWTASIGADALIISSNLIYNYESSNYIQRKTKAYILTVLLILVVIIVLGFLVFGNYILKFVLDFFKVSLDMLAVFKFVKWPIALVLVYLIIKILYTSCPDKRIKSKTVTKGAIFTTCIWMLSSAAYSFYVGHFSHYGRVYGGLANIIILMIWLYILSYILVVGIAINVCEYKDDIKQEKKVIETKGEK